MPEQTKPAKRVKYPYFTAIGLVSIHEQGASRPLAKVRATCYISHRDEAHRLLVRDARYRLEALGVPPARLDELFFEDTEVLELYAHDAKGVRQTYGEKVEAWYDGSLPDNKKREVLIKQRRLVPYDQADMVAIYGTQTAAEPTTAKAKVAAARVDVGRLGLMQPGVAA